jgi:hypothetical protein
MNNPINNQSVKQMSDPDHTSPHLSLRKRLFFVVIFVFLFFGTLLTGLLTKYDDANPEPTPSRLKPTITFFPLPTIPKSQQLNSTQKTIPGQKIDRVVLEKFPGFISKEVLPGNQAQYNIKSELLARPNQIIVSSESMVLFEREILPSSPKKVGYTTFSQLKKTHGDPERIIKGSKFYDWYIEAYIYTSKGFTAIGNPNTNEVYEMHFFIPSSIDEYIQAYGEDLNPGATPPNEGP